MLWQKSVLYELVVLPVCKLPRLLAALSSEVGKISAGDSLSQRVLAAFSAASQSSANAFRRTSACRNATVSDFRKKNKNGGNGEDQRQHASLESFLVRGSQFCVRL
ncbi:hypothetical protein MRX96_024031 [Rhipicephalus microplus]